MSFDFEFKVFLNQIYPKSIEWFFPELIIFCMNTIYIQTYIMITKLRQFVYLLQVASLLINRLSLNFAYTSAVQKRTSGTFHTINMEESNAVGKSIYKALFQHSSFTRKCFLIVRSSKISLLLVKNSGFCFPALTACDNRYYFLLLIIIVHLILNGSNKRCCSLPLALQSLKMDAIMFQIVCLR